MKLSKIFYYSAVTSFFLSMPTHASDPCVDWFKKSALKKDDDCFLRCASLPVDMGTFGCPNQCDDFCEVSEGTKFIFKLSDLYPGLTTEEKALAGEYPTKMLQAYQLTWKTQSICGQLYPTSRTNDESDACRHFIWAGLLLKEFGKDFSDKLLNAHEQEPRQPEEEKAMDLANNRRGLIVAGSLMESGKLNEKELIRSFKDDLTHGRLIVLKKNLKGGVK